MKHYRIFAFTALALAMVFAVTACTPINNELSTGDPEQQRVEIGHLQTVDPEGDLKDKRDDGSGLPFVDNFVVCYDGYYPQLHIPTMAVFNSFEEYSAGIMQILNLDSSSSLAAPGAVSGDDKRVNEGLGRFNNKEYFNNYYVVAFSMELNSGSTKVELVKVAVDGGVTRIYLSSYIPGDVGTCDMASAHVFIGLNKVKFDGYGKIEIYVNNVLVNFAGSDGSIM